MVRAKTGTCACRWRNERRVCPGGLPGSCKSVTMKAGGVRLFCSQSHAVAQLEALSGCKPGSQSHRLEPMASAIIIGWSSINWAYSSDTAAGGCAAARPQSAKALPATLNKAHAQSVAQSWGWGACLFGLRKDAQHPALVVIDHRAHKLTPVRAGHQGLYALDAIFSFSVIGSSPKKASASKACTPKLTKGLGLAIAMTSGFAMTWVNASHRHGQMTCLCSMKGLFELSRSKTDDHTR